MDNKLLYGVVGLLIGVLTTWLLMPIASSGNIMGKSKVTSRSSDKLDAHFIEQMVPHHEDAITMAKLAQQKATRTEVKELANNIISSQGGEISQMKIWYKEWYGRELPVGDEVMQHHGMGSDSGMHMGMMGDESDVVAIENAQDFDVAFVEHMIPHHQMAVMMASMLKDGTVNPKMKELADNIVTAQTNEIDQMRDWLRSWRE